MRRLVLCIGLAATVGASGCSTITGKPVATGNGGEAPAVADAEDFFQGRWYALDENLSCRLDKIVTFEDGTAVFEGDGAFEGAVEGHVPLDSTGASPSEEGIGGPLTLEYRIETDRKTGLRSLVVPRGETEDRFWLAGPDFLLALNGEGYDVMAHCD